MECGIGDDDLLCCMICYAMLYIYAGENAEPRWHPAHARTLRVWYMACMVYAKQ